MKIEEMKNEKLGIPENGYSFHKINENQDRKNEHYKTEEFLRWIINNNPKLFKKKAYFSFINYGDTELVYVIDDSYEKRTILVGQPNIKFGTVRTEYENLIKLSKINPNLVISPTNYFSNEYREAYLTPYLYQARCIASNYTSYGAYVPEPIYTFIPYNEEDTYLICKAMIASLILLYDPFENLGIGECKIGGGDFILEKEFDKEIHNIENVLKRIHLIAARKLISIDLNSYLKLIRKEFSEITYYNKKNARNPDILINWKNRCNMSNEAIEDGIKLGLKLKN